MWFYFRAHWLMGRKHSIFCTVRPSYALHLITLTALLEDLSGHLCYVYQPLNLEKGYKIAGSIKDTTLWGMSNSIRAGERSRALLRTAFVCTGLVTKALMSFLLQSTPYLNQILMARRQHSVVLKHSLNSEWLSTLTTCSSRFSHPYHMFPSVLATKRVT